MHLSMKFFFYQSLSPFWFRRFTTTRSKRNIFKSILFQTLYLYFKIVIIYSVIVIWEHPVYTVWGSKLQCTMFGTLPFVPILGLVFPINCGPNQTSRAPKITRYLPIRPLTGHRQLHSLLLFNLLYQNFLLILFMPF